MDCPNCHTYNPEDRTVCWRCDKPLPKPEPAKKKNPAGSQQWLYIIIAVMLILMLVNFCGLPRLAAPAATPTGLLGPGPWRALLMTPWLAF